MKYIKKTLGFCITVLLVLLAFSSGISGYILNNEKVSKIIQLDEKSCYTAKIQSSISRKPVGSAQSRPST